jgi:hypothetical protein
VTIDWRVLWRSRMRSFFSTIDWRVFDSWVESFMKEWNREVFVLQSTGNILYFWQSRLESFMTESNGEFFERVDMRVCW